MTDLTFSQKLNKWLSAKGKRNFGELEKVFQEKSFAVILLVLMLPSALPIPTGGITHVFAVISMILALEMVFGRKSIWLPKFAQQQNLGETFQTKALPKLVNFIRWFETKSQKRLVGLVNHPIFLRLVGIIIFIFSLSAAIALPFTGLDTLPSLGVVIISLSLILEDVLAFIFGFAVGVVGVVLQLTLGSAALHFLHFF